MKLPIAGDRPDFFNREACSASIQRMCRSVMHAEPQFVKSVVDEVRAVLAIVSPPEVSAGLAFAGELSKAIEAASADAHLAAILLKVPLHGKEFLAKARARVEDFQKFGAWLALVQDDATWLRSDFLLDEESFAPSVQKFVECVKRFGAWLASALVPNAEQVHLDAQSAAFVSHRCCQLLLSWASNVKTDIIPFLTFVPQ